jgi:hypothetical protein
MLQEGNRCAAALADLATILGKASMQRAGHLILIMRIVAATMRVGLPITAGVFMAAAGAMVAIILGLATS